MVKERSWSDTVSLDFGAFAFLPPFWSLESVLSPLSR